MSPRRSALFAIAALALSVGCAKKEPTVLIDDWWNVDFAKHGCEMLASAGTPCVDDPVLEVRDFESRLSTFFSSDPACQGVVFVGFKGPQSLIPKEASGAEWQLMLNFVPGQPLQSWDMVRRNNSHLTSGRGDPKEIAHTVCSVVKNSGGTIVN